MKFLLDTHALIWLDSASARLSATVRQAISDPGNDSWFSPASIWEIQIKVALGKLSLRAPLEEIVAEQLTNSLRELPIRSEHAIALSRLPLVHKDPFDRILAAQAFVDGMILITSDAIFSQYPVKTLW